MTLALALFGQPVAQSRSPALHAAFARQTGIAVDYRALETAPGMLGATLAAFRAGGGVGANVTQPIKIEAAALCAALTERAHVAGAVNLLRWETDGALVGDNVDGTGLVRDLAVNMGLPLAGTRVLVLGGGGAARGATAALVAAGATVTLADRDASRRADLARRFPSVRVHDYTTLAGGHALVINATSASLRGETPPLEAALLAGSLCYDLAYADGPTPFQTLAARAGAAAAYDGWGMLVEQAAESFATWTGVRPDTQALLQR